MPSQTDATATAGVSVPAVDTARFYQEGIVAGVIGAVTVALWFLVVDSLHGRPLYTPTVLGTALFSREPALGPLDTLPVSLDMVAMFTWAHGLVFAVIGGRFFDDVPTCHQLMLDNKHPYGNMAVLVNARQTGQGRSA